MFTCANKTTTYFKNLIITRTQVHANTSTGLKWGCAQMGDVT